MLDGPNHPATPALLAPGSVNPIVVIELLKPVTWFAPVWAFACGAIAASTPGNSFPWALMVAGMVLAGPLVCGASQAINDWCDREVDAINQPDRPIPSGRLPGQTGLFVAAAMCLIAASYAALLGPLVLVAALLGLLSGWAYSAPPLRLKSSGWIGPGLTGLSYEGLAWMTGALVVAPAAALHRPLLAPFALLYSIGALGIMTLNDFKAVAGDRATGIASLPVRLGVRRAAQVAAALMVAPQVVVAAALALAGLPLPAIAIAALVLVQAVLLPRLLRDPEGQARWYSGTGVIFFVAGMMVAAFAIRGASAL